MIDLLLIHLNLFFNIIIIVGIASVFTYIFSLPIIYSEDMETWGFSVFISIIISGIMSFILLIINDFFHFQIDFGNKDEVWITLSYFYLFSHY